MTRLLSTKRLSFAIIMGALALVMQAVVPGIPLGVAGAKLELADIPAVLGSSISGPVGGIICGLFYGVMSTANLALVPSMIIVFGLMGYFADKRNSCAAITVTIIGMRVVVGPVLVAAFMKWIYFPTMSFVDVWILSIVYAAPGAIVSVGIYIFVQKKIPRLLSAIKDNNSQ